MQVIKPEQRVQPRQGGIGTLLPIHPPEIDTPFLQGVMQEVKIGFREIRIGDIKGDGFFSGWIDTHSLCHSRIGLFVRVNTQGRM